VKDFLVSTEDIDELVVQAGAFEIKESGQLIFYSGLAIIAAFAPGYWHSCMEAPKTRPEAAAA